MALTKVTHPMIVPPPFDVTAYGAVGDGTTDDTNAIKAAIAAAQGGLVYFPPGHYRITSALNVGSTHDLNLQGAAPTDNFGYLDGAYANSNDFTTDSISSTWFANAIQNYAVIQCDGCNLIGVDDGASTGEALTVRLIENLVIYGVNGAKIGIYFEPTYSILRNLVIFLFEQFGIATRGGLYSTFENIYLNDNGWNQANVGTTVGYNVQYFSGCQIMVAANKTPNNWWIVGLERPTTMVFKNIGMAQRNWSQANLSGYRGMQIHGSLGFHFDSVNSYMGHIFYIAEAKFSAFYVENYSQKGFTPASTDRYSIYSFWSVLDLGVTTFGGITPPIYNESQFNIPISFAGTAVPMVTPKVFHGNGTPISSGYKHTITPVTPGGQDVYNLWNYLIDDLSGMTALVYVTVLKESDLTVYTTAIWAVHIHDAGGTPEIPASTQIYDKTTAVGTSSITIDDVSFNGSYGIGLTITWGAALSGVDHLVRVGVIGNYFSASY